MQKKKLLAISLVACVIWGSYAIVSVLLKDPSSPSLRNLRTTCETPICLDANAPDNTWQSWRRWAKEGANAEPQCMICGHSDPACSEGRVNSNATKTTLAAYLPQIGADNFRICSDGSRCLDWTDECRIGKMPVSSDSYGQQGGELVTSECMTYDVCGTIGVFQTLYYLQALTTVSARTAPHTANK